jgi:hypothetical protein
MNLENQVCSLELAKRLKELGVKQDSWFWHQEYKNKMVLLDDVPDEYADNYSAFTVAELGEMIGNGCSHSINLNKNRSSITNRAVDNVFVADTEANARAKMLIWLIENGRVKGDENE